MNKLVNLLYQTFATNFLLYYQSHVAHVNTIGRNFVSDHALLGEIYADAQENIDVYGEQLQILGVSMPNNLQSVITTSNLSDTEVRGRAESLLRTIYDAIETQIDTLQRLYDQCEVDGEVALSNLVQDRMLTHKKQCWKLRAILGERE